MPPTECINRGKRWVSVILIPSISRQHLHSTTSSIEPLCQRVPADALAITACSNSSTQPSSSTSTCKVSSFFLHADFPAYSASLDTFVNFYSLFQMVALNFQRILVMLKGGGTIPRSTLHSQDGINLGDIHFCPILRTLRMQCISRYAFAPLQSNMAPELSRMMVILLVFQADSEHKRIINVYVGLMVRRVDCRLYSPNQVNDFIQDIDVDLQVAHDAPKAGRDAGKRHTYCLFVGNLSSVMFVPTDPPYCLVYPTTYVKGAEPDHFDTRNSPVGMHLHRCVC